MLRWLETVTLFSHFICSIISQEIPHLITCQSFDTYLLSPFCRPPSYSGLHPRMATGVASLQLSSQADTRKKRRAPESDGILSSSLYSSTPPNALMAKEETRRNGQFYTNFHRLLQQESPLIPPLLLRNHGRKESGPGKVRSVSRNLVAWFKPVQGKKYHHRVTVTVCTLEENSSLPA